MTPALQFTDTAMLPYTDVQRCTSDAQIVYLRDLYASKLIHRVAQRMLSAGLVTQTVNPADQGWDITANILVIPSEYGNDVLRFAQDVIASHQEQFELDLTS